MIEDAKGVFSKYLREDKREFFAWLIEERDFSEKTSESFIITLRKIERYSKDKGYIVSPVYDLEPQEIDALREVIVNDEEFLHIINYRADNTISALKLLKEYRKYQANDDLNDRQYHNQLETYHDTKTIQKDRILRETKYSAVSDDDNRESDSYTPLYVRYSINLEDYSDIAIGDLNILYRLEARLKSAGIYMLNQLLKLSIKDIESIKDISEGNIKEIHNFLSHFSVNIERARRKKRMNSSTAHIENADHGESYSKLNDLQLIAEETSDVEGATFSASREKILDEVIAKIESIGLNERSREVRIENKNFDSAGDSDINNNKRIDTKLVNYFAVEGFENNDKSPDYESNTLEWNNHEIDETDKKDISNTEHIIEEEPNRIGDLDVSCAWEETDEGYKTIGELFKVQSDAYKDIIISDSDFSVRTYNRLVYAGIRTIDQLLNSKLSDLDSIRGFGAKCRTEIEQYVKTLPNSGTEYKTATEEPISDQIVAELTPFIEDIKHGNFSDIHKHKFSVPTIRVIEKYEIAYDNLGIELAEEALESTEAVLAIREALADYSELLSKKEYCKSVIAAIPKHLIRKRAIAAIRVYSTDLETCNYLSGLLMNEEDSLEKYLMDNAERICDNDSRLRGLIKWCSFDIKEETTQFIDSIKQDERSYTILLMRSEKQTLEKVGNSFDITRERVRQIEKKLLKKFSIWEKKKDIFHHIIFEKELEDCFTDSDLEMLFGEDTQLLLFLMKGIQSGHYNYNKELELFIDGNKDYVTEARAYLYRLPEIIEEDKISKYISIAVNECSIPEKLIKTVFDTTYNKQGKIYYRGSNRLTLEKVYSDILKRFFPNGIHIYTEQQDFREKVLEEYGIDLSHKSDHAIESILGRVGFLVGRGIYKHKDDTTKLSDKLAGEIREFINNSDQPVFMTNTLFAIFEDELREEGVDNKYYLQALLRERFDDEWIFRRDYISKDERYTTIGSSIVSYIKESATPVSKEMIQLNFPGVTDIVINFATNESNIINLFGKYIYGDNLNLSSSDISYMNDVVAKMTDAKGYCHDSDVFEYIRNDYPDLLKNNYVLFPYGMFSVIEYLFGDDYKCNRPFISRNNVVFDEPSEVLKEMVQDSDVMPLQEITEFARDNKLGVYSQLELFNSYNETHLLIDGHNLASITYIGVDEEIAKKVEKMVLEEVTDATPIANLECISKFDAINVPWNAWLIYSILNKWSNELSVYASDSQFRNAYPVVSTSNSEASFHVSEQLNHDGVLHTADDMSNIDSLIGDYIDEELGDL